MLLRIRTRVCAGMCIVAGLVHVSLLIDFLAPHPVRVPSHSVHLAVLGCGIFARSSHLPALRSLQAKGEVRVVALWSRTNSSCAACWQDFVTSGLAPPSIYCGDEGLRLVLSRQDVDAVTVVVAAYAAPELIEKALHAGKSVASEKPAASTVPEINGCCVCVR